MMQLRCRIDLCLRFQGTTMTGMVNCIYRLKIVTIDLFTGYVYNNHSGI